MEEGKMAVAVVMRTSRTSVLACLEQGDKKGMLHCVQHDSGRAGVLAGRMAECPDKSRRDPPDGGTECRAKHGGHGTGRLLAFGGWSEEVEGWKGGSGVLARNQSIAGTAKPH
jgi:hypothetical protein